MIQNDVSPMMAHYLQTKKEYPDSILFYRLGDFYEMFFDDAKKVSRELELTLTGKDCGLEERAPMCGIPYHAASVYIAKLIERGYKVAICEQTEDPKKAKGIVRRDVIRVITPGTVVDEDLLNEAENNYLAVIYRGEGGTGMAFCDVSTSEMYTCVARGDDDVINETARYMPKEIIINNGAAVLSDIIDGRLHVACEIKGEEFFDTDITKTFQQFGKNSVEELGITETCALRAVGAMISYLEYTEKQSVACINVLNVYDIGKYMEIDAATRRNLEITETMREKQKKGSLLGVIDKTKTAMGARMLRQWLEKPLRNPLQINKRLNSVKELVDDIMLRGEFGDVLAKTYDISRIISRLSLGTVTPKDMAALRDTLTVLPELEAILLRMKSPIFSGMAKNFDTLADVCDLLTRAIAESPAALLRDGGVIKEGFSAEIDESRRAMTDGKGWLRDIEIREREKTKIPKLKISYNKVFGYYIEVTNAYKDMVPEGYIRKQTLTNCERFITEELKQIEDKILGASERVINLEIYEFEKVRKTIANETERLKYAAYIIAVSDALVSLAETAYKNNYTMPEVYDNGIVEIHEGRHPIVEKMLRNSMFVPNDTFLNRESDRMIILTGPNMAGKSTYMRQIALIVLMAQVGSFVPAKYAKIGVVDRIFTRVGASDDIAAGQSTFMTEMVEVSNILKNATRDSLIILDEIGRGTSTFDGLSIAQSVAEYIANKRKIGAKTLFATHYHELTSLEDTIDGVKNYRVAVKKHGDDITFLRKIVRGGTDDSYGIEVAALSGVPKEVIKRAKEILKFTENGGYAEEVGKHTVNEEVTDQLGFSDTSSREITDELKKTDVTTLTPIEAMNMLYRLAKKAKENNI